MNFFKMFPDLSKADHFFGYAFNTSHQDYIENIARPAGMNDEDFFIFVSKKAELFQFYLETIYAFFFEHISPEEAQAIEFMIYDIKDPLVIRYLDEAFATYAGIPHAVSSLRPILLNIPLPEVDVPVEFFTFSAFFEKHALLFLLAIPLLSIIALFFSANAGNNFLYKFSLISTTISFIYALILWYNFNENAGDFQFRYDIPLMPSLAFGLRMGMDGISLFFVLLTNLFIFLSIMSLTPSTLRLKEVLLHLLFLQWSVLASFLFLDILGFFLFFEMTLIPIYFLVLIWGSRERRIRASYLISIYTLLGSIFMFFNLLYLLSKTGTTDYETLLTFHFTEEDQKFLWITFFLSFAAKIPLFPMHIWLPEAHVEAPTLGSVLLAVLLLKLGTYGLIRFSLPLFPEGTVYFTPLVSTLAIMGIIYTCFAAIRQIDLKKIIAYSSVGHMNVVLLGIMAGNSEALEGAIFQMLSHGIVSGALFFAVGTIYERYSVRSLKYFGGLTYFYPLFAIVFLTFSMANISFPLTSSFVGEFLIFMGLFQQSFWATFFASTSMVLGAVYSLWTYNRIFFGNVKTLSLTSYKDLDRKEFSLFAVLIFILFLMGINASLFLDGFLLDSINILEHGKGGRVINNTISELVDPTHNIDVVIRRWEILHTIK